MLIGMDTCGPEGAIVDRPTKSLRLGQTIKCLLKAASLRPRQERIAHSTKPITVKPISVTNVPIRLRKSLPKRHDFLSEPRSLPINFGGDKGVFASLVDDLSTGQKRIIYPCNDIKQVEARDSRTM